LGRTACRGGTRFHWTPRQRYVLQGTWTAAGGARAHIAFAKYLAGKMGANIVYKFKTDNFDKIVGELTLHQLIRKFYAATQYIPIEEDEEGV